MEYVLYETIDYHTTMHRFFASFTKILFTNFFAFLCPIFDVNNLLLGLQSNKNDLYT